MGTRPVPLCTPAGGGGGGAGRSPGWGGRAVGAAAGRVQEAGVVARGEPGPGGAASAALGRGEAASARGAPEAQRPAAAAPGAEVDGRPGAAAGATCVADA